MPTAQRILFLLVVLASFSGPAISVTTETLLAATQTLVNTDHLSLSLTLQLLADNSSLLVDTPSLTIFAPSEAAFSRSGQPSFSRILYQCSPVPYPLPSLRSLPVGSKIPTLLANLSLVITSNANSSLNGVKIDQDPIFDSGSLLILGVDEFFDMGFETSGPGAMPTVCGFNVSAAGYYSFGGATKELRSKGYGIMASFLDLQLPVNYKWGTGLTIFAPADWAAKDYKFKNYSSFILSHISPCKYSWGEVANFDDGFVLDTLTEGGKISLSKAGGGGVGPLLNGVSVRYPNLYMNDWLVVHGLDGLLVDYRKRNGAAATSVKERFLMGAGSFLVNVISSLFLYIF